MLPVLEMTAVTATTAFDVRELWSQKSAFSAKVGGFTATVPPHDLLIYRLSKPKEQ